MNGRMSDEFERIWKEAVGLIEVLSSNLPGKIEENNEKSQVPSIPVKMPTEHLSNTSLEHYHYTNPFSSFQNV
jgi:hypothetical protein